jgi:hypothetical protein
VQQAIKEARLQGLMSVEERKQKGGKHLTNVIRVLSPEWAAWLARRSKARGVGESKFAPPDTRGFFPSLESRAALRGSRQTGFRRGDSGSGAAERAAERPRF